MTTTVFSAMVNAYRKTRDSVQEATDSDARVQQERKKKKKNERSKDAIFEFLVIK